MSPDAALLAVTLERLGELDEDIAPAVFVRFIERRPDLAPLFREDRECAEAMALASLDALA